MKFDYCHNGIDDGKSTYLNIVVHLNYEGKY